MNLLLKSMGAAALLASASIAGGEEPRTPGDTPAGVTGPTPPGATVEPVPAPPPAQPPPARGAASAALPPPAPPPTFVLALHGFVSGTLFAQDQALATSNGAGGVWVRQLSPTANGQTGAGQPADSRTVAPVGKGKYALGGDVRQTRLNFSVTGPSVLRGAVPKAVAEIDFFNGFGPGNYGNVSVLPRLRLAYAELDWGAHRVLFGQAGDLVGPISPSQVAHIGSGLSGGIGYRRPGVFGYHTLGARAGLNLELAWEVGRSTWADGGKTTDVNGIGQGYAGSGGDPYGFTLGEASGLPAVEARITVAHGTRLSAYVAGHYSKVKRSGLGGSIPPASAGGDLEVLVGAAGARATAGPLTVAAVAWAGRNLAPLGNDFNQFQRNSAGDIREVGGWAQLSFAFTRELSLAGYAGLDAPDESQSIAAGHAYLRNVSYLGSLQYREGGYALAVEYLRLQTKLKAYPTTDGTVTPETARSLSRVLAANQFLLSGAYFF